jgi:putative ABC transport system substrate-binding protein
VFGCGEPGSAPVTAVPAVPTPTNLGKIAVVRLGRPDVEEPSEKDVRDGLKEASLVEGTSYTLETLDAGGDLSRVASLLDDAVKSGSALVITLDPATTQLAAERLTTIPVVGYLGLVPPAPLGLGKSSSDHRPNLTGVFSPLGRSNLVAMACGCLPKEKRRLGIVIDPSDPVSVALKESLLVADLDILTIPPKFEIAEAPSAADIPAALESLVKRQAAALLLLPGRAIDDRLLIQAATRAKLPVFGYSPAHAHAGAVLVRVPSLRWGGFETGRRAGRVLCGVDPQALPFEEGTVYGTIANQSASKQLGITIRGEFLRTAVLLP